MKINGNLSIVKLFPGILQQQFIAGLLHTAILVVKLKHTRAWKLSHRKPKKIKRNQLLICFRTLQKNMISKSDSFRWLRIVLFIDVGGYVIYSYDSSGRGRFFPITRFTKHGTNNDCTHSTSLKSDPVITALTLPLIITRLVLALSLAMTSSFHVPKVFYFRMHKPGSWKRFE